VRFKKLKPGTRVRIPDPAVPLVREVLTGFVVGPDEWDGYYLIRLDRPAKYRHASGEIEDLNEIIESSDNVELLDPVKPAKKISAGGRHPG
jgi:hypothetical protein